VLVHLLLLFSLQPWQLADLQSALLSPATSRVFCHHYITVRLIRRVVQVTKRCRSQIGSISMQQMAYECVSSQLWRRLIFCRCEIEKSIVCGIVSFAPEMQCFCCAQPWNCEQAVRALLGWYVPRIIHIAHPCSAPPSCAKQCFVFLSSFAHAVLCQLADLTID